MFIIIFCSPIFYLYYLYIIFFPWRQSFYRQKFVHHVMSFRIPINNITNFGFLKFIYLFYIYFSLGGQSFYRSQIAHHIILLFISFLLGSFGSPNCISVRLLTCRTSLNLKHILNFDLPRCTTIATMDNCCFGSLRFDWVKF